MNTYTDNRILVQHNLYEAIRVVVTEKVKLQDNISFYRIVPH